MSQRAPSSIADGLEFRVMCQFRPLSPPSSNWVTHEVEFAPRRMLQALYDQIACWNEQMKWMMILKLSLVTLLSFTHRCCVFVVVWEKIPIIFLPTDAAGIVVCCGWLTVWAGADCWFNRHLQKCVFFPSTFTIISTSGFSCFAVHCLKYLDIQTSFPSWKAPIWNIFVLSTIVPCQSVPPVRRGGAVTKFLSRWNLMQQ